ncbi:MAG: orotidine-5'-phosphate decarboxylase, partial [Bryobacteraceae bacterium]
LIRSIGDAAEFYKVGLELYAAAGMDFVDELANSFRKKVFLDLKLYDIGETVKRTTSQVIRHNVTYLTVHAVRSVMCAAVQGRGSSNTELLAVTVLTSFDQSDLRDLDYPESTTVTELVESRVKKAMAIGMNGVVCSPLEIARVRQIAGPHLKLIIPGVRSAGASAGDQKRVATPAQAMRDGADHIVVGRQVTRAPDPRAACQQILEEL